MLHAPARPSPSLAQAARRRSWSVRHSPTVCPCPCPPLVPAACATVVLSAVSFGTFGVVLVYVRRMFHRAMGPDMAPEHAVVLRCLLRLLLALWTAFPVVWLLADLNIISETTEHVCWGVCDYLAKVGGERTRTAFTHWHVSSLLLARGAPADAEQQPAGGAGARNSVRCCWCLLACFWLLLQAVFSSQLWQGNLTSAAQRQETAMRAWEGSNRVVVVNRLQALLSAKGRLLHTMSHELKTPLLGILGAAPP